jgi:hypothetical protein
MIKYYLTAGVIVAASLGGYKVADWQWQSKWSAHLAADADANAKALEDVQNKQKRLTVELEHAYKTAKDLQDKYESDRIAAADSAKRLREQIEKYRTAAGNDNSTAISVSANAATDRIVLANVLARADAAAGILADYADANRNALISCNAEYKLIRGVNGGRN